MLPINPKHKIETKVEKEQKQKKFFIGKYKKGLKLFANDIENKKIYEVEIEKKKDLVFNGKEKSRFQAKINKNHPLVWALNLKNACRKFGVTYIK